MSPLSRRQNQLFFEGINLADVAHAFGTPAYVYSKAAIVDNYSVYANAFGDFPYLICYSVKANSNLAVLNLLAQKGAGFDIVSGGELARVLKAGGRADRTVFSGVGKRVDEMRFALEQGVACFNVESESELLRLNQVAGDMNLCAPVSLRVNPDVDPKTHPYISTGLSESKFGIPISDALRLYQKIAAMPHLKAVGLDCHIGSQITEISPFIDALDLLLELLNAIEKAGIQLHHLDIGGGVGVKYQDETPPDIFGYIQQVKSKLKGRHLAVFMEPGRSIVANAGVLLTRVEYLKSNGDQHFAVIDAGMNDLIRPALYQSWMGVEPLTLRQGEPSLYDLVGPVCESGDFLAKQRSLVLEEGDLLAIRSAGAYGFTMCSNYNSRPKVVELMVDGVQVHQVRARESLDDLWRNESILPVAP